MIRIKGIVSTATKAKRGLSEGILSSQVPEFKKFVTNSVQTIEKLCLENKINPSNLPTRSRKAYQFLKSIDLANLPVVDSPRTQATELLSFRVKNLVKEIESIQYIIWHISPLKLRLEEYLTSLHSQIKSQVRNVETVLETGKVTPTDLTPKSRSGYAWLKFLSERENLEQHLTAVGTARAIATGLCTQKGLEHKFIIKLFNSAYLCNYRTIK